MDVIYIKIDSYYMKFDNFNKINVERPVIFSFIKKS